jgi:hypothetical protein
MMLRRRSRTDRFAAEVKEAPPAARIAVLALAAVGLTVLAYVARQRLWQALAIAADAVEEVADTVEDAAEDLAEAAQARAGGDAD